MNIRNRVARARQRAHCRKHGHTEGERILAGFCTHCFAFINPAVMATLEHSERQLRCHDPKICAGQPCTLHNRTNHHMRSWRQHWRSDRQIMERLCPEHGTGHPDPDEWRIRTGEDDGTHGCCGCCVAPIVEFPYGTEDGAA